MYYTISVIVFIFNRKNPFSKHFIYGTRWIITSKLYCFFLNSMRNLCALCCETVTLQDMCADQRNQHCSRIAFSLWWYLIFLAVHVRLWQSGFSVTSLAFWSIWLPKKQAHRSDYVYTWLLAGVPWVTSPFYVLFSPSCISVSIKTRFIKPGSLGPLEQISLASSLQYLWSRTEGLVREKGARAERYGINTASAGRAWLGRGLRRKRSCNIFN